MYEELIRSCRACATGYVGNCDSCMFSGEDCYKQLHKASADAIEELTKDLERSKNYEMFWNKEVEEALRRFQVVVANKPRWIPVTERLPEESEGLNWHEDLMIRFTSVWCCDAETGTLEVRNRLQGKMTGNEYLDQYTKDTNWHWSKGWWEPTHWMPIVPLPEPPKEG